MAIKKIQSCILLQCVWSLKVHAKLSESGERQMPVNHTHVCNTKKQSKGMKNSQWKQTLGFFQKSQGRGGGHRGGRLEYPRVGYWRQWWKKAAALVP